MNRTGSSRGEGGGKTPSARRYGDVAWNDNESQEVNRPHNMRRTRRIFIGILTLLLVVMLLETNSGAVQNIP